MNQFEYKDLDIEGEKILDVIASADKFNTWMYQTISKMCTGEILEIGSGIGNISQYFLKDNKRITLSDIRDNYCSRLNAKFSLEPSFAGVVKLDLVHPDFDSEYKYYLNKFDSIFALNVVEHIENDVLAISNCKKLLKKNGKLIILVPAYSFLYNKLDKNLEHYRRYNKKSLKDILVKNGLTITNSQYFNLMGIFGWFVSGKLQSHESIPQNQMTLYNKLVFLFKLIDKITFNKIGLSVICAAEK